MFRILACGQIWNWTRIWFGSGFAQCSIDFLASTEIRSQTEFFSRSWFLLSAMTGYTGNFFQMLQKPGWSLINIFEFYSLKCFQVLCRSLITKEIVRSNSESGSIFSWYTTRLPTLSKRMDFIFIPTNSPSGLTRYDLIRQGRHIIKNTLECTSFLCAL